MFGIATGALASIFGALESLGYVGQFFVVAGGFVLGVIAADKISDWRSRRKLVDEEALREEIAVLARSAAEPAFRRVQKLANRIKDSLDQNYRTKQLLAILIEQSVVDPFLGIWAVLRVSLEPDATPMGLEKWQDLIGDCFRKYQRLVMWVYYGGREINFPFSEDADYQRWEKEDRDFLRRLRDLIATEGFSELRQIVEEIGWDDEVRNP